MRSVAVPGKDRPGQPGSLEFAACLGVHPARGRVCKERQADTLMEDVVYLLWQSAWMGATPGAAGPVLASDVASRPVDDTHVASKEDVLLRACRPAEQWDAGMQSGI